MKKHFVILIILLICSVEIKAEDFWTLTKGPDGAVVNSVCEMPNGNLIAGTESGLFYSTNDGDSWKTLNFYGQNIRAITVTDSGKIYVAISGDLQLSTDNGVNWSSIDNGLDRADFKIIHPGNNGKLYAIAHTSHQYNKLFVANDDNGGWSQITTNINLIQSFDIKPSNGYFFIGTYGQGIFRSIDNGENIEKVGLDTLTVRSFMIDSSGVIYAGTQYHGLYSSNDDGNNWTFLGLEGYSIYSISKNSDNHIFCGTLYNGVMRSTDNGGSWTQQNSGLINYQINNVYTDKRNKIFIGANGDGVFSSTNNGTNWNHSSKGMEGSHTTALATNNSGRIFVTTFGAGIWYTDDKGNNWIRCNNGLDTPGFTKLKINSQGHIFAGSGSGAIYRSTDNGSNWTKVRNSVASAQLGDIFIDNQGNVYIGITNNGIYKSTNNGDDWMDIGLNDKVHRSIHVVNDTIILVGTYNFGLYRSTDNGQSWTHPGTMSSTIYAIEKDVNGTIYLGGYNGQFEKSTDGGTSWSLINNFIQQINSILCGSEGKIFVGMNSDGIKASLDNGSTWEILNTGLKSDLVNSLIFDSDGDIFAALTEGVYTSSDLVVDLDPPTLINPADNETGETLNPVFTWNQVVNASEYQFQLSDSEDFSNELDFSTAADTSRTADHSFDFATKYYWRVRSKQNLSVSDWSEIRDFTTTIDSPVLISPVDNSEDVSVPATFHWHNVFGASSYILIISENSDFSTTFSFNDIITDTTSLQSGLNSYTSYYWKVQALGSGTTSLWSETWKLTTALAAPVLTAPCNDSSGLVNVVVCSWESVPNASEYIIEMATEHDFISSSVIYSGQSSASNSHTFTLNYAKKYYWHVKSKTSNSESQWSEYRAFSTGYAPPVLITPANGMDELPIPLTLTWEKYKDADKYYLEISTDENFTDLEYLNMNIKDTFLITDKIEYNKMYFWRVKTLVEDTYSFWSETRRFSTGIMPPALTGPANGEDTFVSPFIFTWDYSGNAVGYYIQISKDENFEEIEIEDSMLTEKQYTAAIMEFFKTYYWRIKAKVEDKYSLWSNTWSFTTSLDKPLLSYPANSASEMDLTLEFSWHPVLGAEYYELQVSEYDNFENFVFIKDSVYDINKEVSNLDYQKNYYWRVRAKNENGIGDWSDYGHFTTKKEPNEVEDLIVSQCISIFPNPFDEDINFSMELNQSARVELRIFDIMGNLKYRKIDNTVSKGVNTITWKSNDACDAVYLYQIKINEKYISGLMYLVR